MKRRAGNDGVELLRQVRVLELGSPVALFVRCIRVDANRLLPARAEHRHETAERATADLDDACRRRG